MNAMRGATVAIVSHICFCSPVRPLQCLTPLSAASAATVTAGGIIWVRSASPVEVCEHVTKRLQDIVTDCILTQSNELEVNVA